MSTRIEIIGSRKVTYDDYNPRIYFEEIKCRKCGEWFPAEEVECGGPTNICSDCIEEEE